ncbi:MAG TPA: DNA-formamidopyrimidine glycosylase [Candidatus Paceibacterota bacterium]|nr:DNA-formamidopyrimidine glycosylase [Candidatus Paceibacterota bacterium]HMP18972.1 DNA-formamidopyrimidine glycosylase [Candidatus Paceibacterota bacterium]HMP85402.1 DNA-formamidopyrimidine glycosylase [Candidatus Paceibacterota bacterium]
MPELPEVTTTSRILDKILKNKKIIFVWTNYKSDYFKGKENIKDPKYFDFFKKEILNQKIKKVHRIGKNVLIDISGPKTILIHMKMTGHLLYGNYKYDKNKNEWSATDPGPLQDKFNQHIRVVFELDNGKKLVLSDVRKFAKVALIKDSNIKNFKDLKDVGPDPLDQNFDLKKFTEVLEKKPKGKIKTVLMDQSIISGIGNIYSDEALWMTGIHPERPIFKIKKNEFDFLLKNIKKVLNLGIDFGGDSTSDYRQPDGRPGNFHHKHQVYKRKGQKCKKKNCDGQIIRKIIGGRSAHFCDKHQI